MKSFQRWMLLCAGLALGASFLLPHYGFQLTGFPLLIGLLMISVCILPMIFRRSKASVGGGGGRCCGGKREILSNDDTKAQPMAAQKPACH